MPIVDTLPGTLQIQPGTGIPVPFVELTPKTGPVSEGSCNWETPPQNVRVFLCKFRDTPEFIQYCLGTSYRVADGTINRVLPMQDPFYYTMFAAGISSFKPYGAPAPYTDPEFDEGFGNIPEFQYALITVRFEVPDFLVIDDATLAAKFNSDESKRFVSTYYEPGEEVQTRPAGNNWKFAEEKLV